MKTLAGLRIFCINPFWDLPRRLQFEEQFADFVRLRDEPRKHAAHIGHAALEAAAVDVEEAQDERAFAAGGIDVELLSRASGMGVRYRAAVNGA
jgi:hypothetical protein